MVHTRKNEGVCSESTTVTIEDGVIQDIRLEGGCNGNIKGICTLLKGQDPNSVIELLNGITCKDKGTSCPDQISICLAEALKQ